VVKRLRLAKKVFDVDRKAGFLQFGTEPLFD